MSRPNTRAAKTNSGILQRGHCVRGNKRGRAESVGVRARRRVFRNSFGAFSEFNGLMDSDQMAARGAGTGIKQPLAPLADSRDGGLSGHSGI